MSSNKKKNTSRSSKRSKPSRRRRQHQTASAEVEIRHAVPDHPLIPAGEPQFITTDQKLNDLIDHVRQVGRCAFDTEFIGETNYYPQLCLLQIATPQLLAVVDAMADLDLQPMWKLLADESVQKIVHAGRQDVEPVMRYLGRPPANLFDTQIAAGMAAMPYPLSLTRLAKVLLGVRLGKSLTFTSWDDRPLSSAHLHYAANDVRYLPALYDAMIKRLQKWDHVDWAKQESSILCDAASYEFDLFAQTMRVRGAKKLTGRQLAVLHELVAVRDKAARSRDVPPRSLVKDDVLATLARQPVKTVDRLASFRGVPRPFVQQWGRKVIKGIERALALPEDKRPKIVTRNETPAQQYRINSLWSTLQSYCWANGIDPTLAANRQQLAEFYLKTDDQTTHRLNNGWRGELIGQFLRGFIDEKQSLATVWQGGQLRLMS